MPHSIEQRLVAIGRRARRLAICYALCWVVGAFLAMLMLLATADYLLRFDSGLRVIAMLTVAGVTAWSVVRFLVPALRFRPTLVQIAQHVERRYPEFQDRLASTVEFLGQSEDDPTAGSVELRRAVVAQTEAETEGLNWWAVIDQRPAKRAGLVGGVIIVIALMALLFAPHYSRVGLARLFNPLGNEHWPRIHYLTFREPVARLALGQLFEVEVIDQHGTPLPDDVRVQYRYRQPGERATEEQEKPLRINGAMVARKETVTRPFEYRAVGGDDHTMPWIAVEVIEPPRAESVEVTLHPPAYTGYPAFQSPQRIEALIGTGVEMTGRASKPLSAAVLKQENGPDVLTSISTDGRRFTISGNAGQPMVVEKSGRYWFELTDRDELAGGADDRWEIRAAPDAPPTVSVDRPAANLFVTSTASVPVKATVKDNLAVRRVWLVYSRGDQSEKGERAIELFVGPEAAPVYAGSTPVSSPGETQNIDYRWELGPLNLPPETQLMFHVAAEDYQPKMGMSAPRRLTIVTPAELEERLTAQQAAILAELRRVLELQRDVRSHTAGVQEQVTQVGSLRKADVDQLQTAELNQRQVRRTLASPSEGVVAQIANLTAQLESNRLDTPELGRRLQQMGNSIGRLERTSLPEIERQLMVAVKESQAMAGRADAEGIQQSLASAGEHQDEVIATLEKLLDELTEWSRYRGLARDIGQIRQQQAALQKQTEKIGAETLALEASNLSSQQKADLNNLARGQSELTAQLEKLLVRMGRIAGPTADGASSSAESVADALQAARRLGLTEKMRQIAADVAANRIGQAIEHQSKVLQGLDEMLDTLANRHEQELSRLVKKLRKAEEALADLRQQQDALQKKMQSLVEQAKQPGADREEIKRQLERLGREQRRLQEETERFARQLQRLQAEKASKSTADAASRMNTAGDRAGEGKPSEALDEAAAVKRNLDEAQKQLAERRRQAEQDLAHEQLAKIGDALKSLSERQGRIVDEIFAYDAHRRSPTGLTRAQSQSVLDLSRTQAGLADETTMLAEKVAAAEVFYLALERAAAQMKHAAGRLENLDTGEPAQRAADEALHRLQQILEALAQDQSNRPPKPDQGGGAGGGGGDSPPADKIATLAEVKLLKLMQEEVNRRTRQLDQAVGRQTEMTAQQRREYIELAGEQGRLAELLLKKSAPAEPLENEPNSLPDVRRNQEDVP